MTAYGARAVGGRSVRLGALWCHWPSGTLFRLTGAADGCVCGIDEGGGWGVWPLAECAEVAPCG